MNHTRHIGLFQLRQSVTLIGAGGIGSPTAISLAKMGCPLLYLFDPDEISEENIATQMYPYTFVGCEKVSGLKELVAQFSDETQVIVSDEFVGPMTHLYGDIIISAVDSIWARKNIWQAVKRSAAGWYLDARMGAEVFQLYAVNLDGDTSWYDKAISEQSDATAREEPCTSKATIYTGFIGAGHVGSAVRKIITGRPVPHFTVHNILEASLLEV